jgi:thiamine-phosphate pyrophosphorylase
VTVLRPRGFYGVLDVTDDWQADLEGRADRLAQALLRGGAAILQLRAKGVEPERLVGLARAARAWTRAAGVPLVINDHLALALDVGADGVHLGQADLPLALARERAQGRLAIGISTHDERQARAAAEGGADYLGFGPVFATTTKANPDPVQGLAGLARAVRAAGHVPVVAIGGIGLDDVAEVRRAGAAAACVIRAVNGAVDVTAAARRVAAAFV